MIDFEKELRELLLSKEKVYPRKLYDAINYALFPGGKRIRPTLTFLSAGFLGIEEKRVIPFALAIELIHSYSLIHDDLPCMDNDDYRRGKLSCHKAFGEDVALLAGDALLNLAYEVLLSAVLSDTALAPSARLISEYAGGEGMIGGQAIEIAFDEFDEERIRDLCQKKTGALIKASVMAPSCLSNDEEKIAALSAYADAVGLAFQLQDDLLDADKCESKSFLAVLGKEKTLAELKKLNEIARASLAMWKEGSCLSEISEKLTNRKS